MKGLMNIRGKPNCFEKTEAGGAFFIFHQITDELSTKHEPRLRTTAGGAYCPYNERIIINLQNTYYDDKN
jgi:hypothetical protein